MRSHRRIARRFCAGGVLLGIAAVASAQPVDTLTPAAPQGDEAIVLEMFIQQDRADWGEVCEEELDRSAMVPAEFDRRCDDALRQFAGCKIAMMKMMPEKVYTTYFVLVAQGVDEDEAMERSRTSENWGGMTDEEAMISLLPAVGYFSECISTIFE